ncbi:MAG: flagella basal body P-ring formation protein FlgA [Hydrogenothermaceae bacterium]|nr:flagella basal body P-ring formation protein FlgA [Hydrogenothermaceae bacterium]
MVYLFLLFVLVFDAFGDEDLNSKLDKMLNDYVRENFSQYEIISLVPIAKSYIKTLEGKEFSKVECKSKGSSSLYLYLECKFLNGEQLVSSFPVTFRIKEGGRPVIEKNKKVDIVYITKNLRIKMMGVAVQSGKVGDIIEVKNISTGKVLRGRVISENEVLVEEQL